MTLQSAIDLKEIKGRLFEKKHAFLRNNIWIYKAD